MNEIELLREWDADAPPLTDTARARARFRLYQAMQAPAAAPATVVGRRPLLRVAVACAAAAAVTATVVVAQNTGDGAPRTQVVSASTVLRGAAAEALRSEKPLIPRDDQFIYTKGIIEQTPVSGGPKETYVDESWSSVDGSKRSYVSELGYTQWVPPAQKGQYSWPPTEWSKLEQLPLDPGRLTITLRESGTKPNFGRPTRADQWPQVQFLIASLLRHSVLPKGLRSAAFEALADVPGVEVLPGRTDAGGRAAFGIRYVGPAGTPWASGRRVLLFDAKSYQYLGQRERLTIDGTTYDQWSHVAAEGVVDRVFQRP